MTSIGYLRNASGGDASGGKSATCSSDPRGLARSEDTILGLVTFGKTLDVKCGISGRRQKLTHREVVLGLERSELRGRVIPVIELDQRDNLLISILFKIWEDKVLREGVYVNKIGDRASAANETDEDNEGTEGDNRVCSSWGRNKGERNSTGHRERVSHERKRELSGKQMMMRERERRR